MIQKEADVLQMEVTGRFLGGGWQWHQACKKTMSTVEHWLLKYTIMIVLDIQLQHLVI